MTASKAVLLQAFLFCACLCFAFCQPVSRADSSSYSSTSALAPRITPTPTAPPSPSPATGDGDVRQSPWDYVKLLAGDSFLRGVVGITGAVLAVDGATSWWARRQREAWAKFARAHFGRDTLSTAQLSLHSLRRSGAAVELLTNEQLAAFERAKRQIEQVDQTVDKYLRCFTNELANRNGQGRITNVSRRLLCYLALSVCPGEVRGCLPISICSACFFDKA